LNNNTLTTSILFPPPPLHYIHYIISHAKSSFSLMCCFFSSRRRHTRSVSAFLLNRSSDLKQNAKREMRLRLGKVTVADVLAAQPVTTNLLKFMRASIKM